MLTTPSGRPQRWYRLHPVPASWAPRFWLDWLLEPGSLTQRLKNLAKGDFQVKVIREYWSQPRLDEAQSLAIEKRQRVFIREVELWGCGQCWVRARTLIPAASLKGRLSGLRRLGNQPLGAKLFTLPGISRGPMEICHQHTASGSFWARRSVFSLGKKSLLVTEVFMPVLEQVE